MPTVKPAATRGERPPQATEPQQAPLLEPLPIQRERTVLRELLQLAAERARGESALETGFKTRNEAAEREYQQARPRISKRYEADKEAGEKEYQETKQRIAGRFESDHGATEKEYDETREEINDRFEGDKETREKDFQELLWTINTVFEGEKKEGPTPFKEAEQRAAGDIQKIVHAAKEQLEALGQQGVITKVRVFKSKEVAEGDPLMELEQSSTEAETQLAQLKALVLPRLCKGKRLLWFVLVVWLLSIAPAILASGLENWQYGLAASGGVAVAFGAFALWLYWRSRSGLLETFQNLHQAVYDAETARKRCRDEDAAIQQRQLAELTKSKQKRDQDLAATRDKHKRKMAGMKQAQEAELRKTDEKYLPRLAEIKQRRDTDARQAEETYRKQQAESKQRYETDLKAAEEKHRQQLTDSKAAYDRDWNTLTNHWQQGLDRILGAAQEIDADYARIFPNWSSASSRDWAPSSSVPRGIRFGEFQVSMSQIPQGVPRDERLKRMTPAGFSLPALLPFPNFCCWLMKACDEGRNAAVQVLQAAMFRFLTALPPGKVRFTIIDPVGLGENFAAFMHLGDYDEQLVTSRIWTEVPHIEQRLADLTGHMENVIQKYLRNQYESIEEYNEKAGEVAEPFRVLVVANFPVNFSVEAARRLVSIASTGARCGVYTLISLDTKQTPPQGFNVADLEQPGVQLIWNDNRFAWKDDDFGKYPLQLDKPPGDDFSNHVLHIVGEKAKEAKRVEVPFEFIAPAPDRWWTSDSSDGINVALGRAGATKRQHLRLGHGTAQHVLIAGKTGSGKSTLLHALVTNLALFYSPDEVELYLVDFKKGVEFKTYATHELPHARVVAIESEREFGLSVLQRLDAELKLRGDRFRDAGAQNLQAYRAAVRNGPTPRILLIVDEFQEFFVEDDKVAQEAALVLDRLVRQGRAFGIHVLLGSQTLGGAYTLARSTIDQMAVRIALQCSEADAHIILSDDNSAARLLSRPGEAIYNDANGLVEGNNPFQVVWLDDERREQYLEGVRELTRQRQPVTAQRGQIVFEGNVAAHPDKNPLLDQLLRAPAWPEAVRACPAWLGDAVAIKDPTAAVFRRQSGNNLLIIGQQEEAALGIMSTMLVSLAAQQTPERSRFYLLDSTPDDSPLHGNLAKLPGVVPHQAKAGGWRDLPTLIDEVANELDRRQKANETDAPAIYLFVYGLQRFRDIRRQEEDFGFSSRREEKPSPSKQFANILREGPGLGVHTIIWCDNLNNVNRAIDRQGLREFELRVLFQMSATDSSNLIDTPLASRLGMHRALFFSEEQGRLEKFRPYGLPAEEWLGWVREKLVGRLKS